QPVEIADDVSRSERKKKTEATREPLRAVAEQLADPQSEYAKELNRLWAEEWERRKARWQQFLRWLRRFVLPRAKEKKQVAKRIRRVGGLSVKRLQTIRDLYQVLKAFHMRP